ncbi:MAG: hypothetical protein NZ926_02635 [Candidatus Methanomethylicia archaeon]|nr:hypothetical protein [Candidatus Methanomethylicia archaeon]MDW7989028.1 hypothetical protein [Nitrososphaerota archaeon]
MPEQRFRIAPTGRGAIFRAKRWFYATFYTKSLPLEVKEGNKKIWTDLARRMVEEINKYGYSDNPTRLSIKYETGPNGEFKPISVMLEVMSIEPVKTIVITTVPEEERKIEVLKQFEELLKKAKELGIDVKELIKSK